MAHFAESRFVRPATNHPVKPWRVLHACETGAQAAVLAEAQSVAGMSPQLLSREYWKPEASKQKMSLMTAWHDVRDWRQALNEAEALTSAQIVHAHSFASAMAGVRGSVPLVYDFPAPLEEIASHQTNNGPWLLRSFRVAEQFALSRASAVVVHCDAMQKVARERGAASENIFMVPEPWAVEGYAMDRKWAADHAIDLGYDVVLFALADPVGFDAMLRAFAAMSVELDRAVLVFECDNPNREKLVALARELEIADLIRCVGSSDREQAIGCADVVIAPQTGGQFGHPNVGMLAALAAGKPVVAADVPENRECSTEGRGCVWFRDGDTMDLVHRATFVTRNPEFSRSLGENGREHVRKTRAAQVVAVQYDEIYRHAQARRTDNIPKIPAPKIYALDAM